MENILRIRYDVGDPSKMPVYAMNMYEPGKLMSEFDASIQPDDGILDSSMIKMNMLSVHENQQELILDVGSRWYSPLYYMIGGSMETAWELTDKWIGKYDE